LWLEAIADAIHRGEDLVTRQHGRDLASQAAHVDVDRTVADVSPLGPDAIE
jgi:hypothetical protein